MFKFQHRKIKERQLIKNLINEEKIKLALTLESVPFSLKINDRNLKSLNNIKYIEGTLNLIGCESLKSIDNLRIIEGDLKITGTKIKRLPENLIITGEITKGFIRVSEYFDSKVKAKYFNEQMKLLKEASKKDLKRKIYVFLFLFLYLLFLLSIFFTNYKK